MPIEILNYYKTKERDGVIYVGRNPEKWGFDKSSSIPELANPYIVGVHGERGECVDLYRKWIWKQIRENNRQIVDALLSIPDDCKLICFCAPKKTCHAYVIVLARNYILENIKKYEK